MVCIVFSAASAVDVLDAVLMRPLLVVGVFLLARFVLRRYVGRNQRGEPSASSNQPDSPTIPPSPKIKAVDAILHSMDPDPGEVGAAVKKWLPRILLGFVAFYVLMGIVMGIIFLVFK